MSSRWLTMLTLVLLAFPARAQNIVVTPNPVQAEVTQWTVGQGQLSIANTGAAPLNWTMEIEIDPITAPPRLMARQSPLAFDRDARLRGDFSPELRMLLDRARTTGSAAVIVHLDVPFAPEGRLGSQAAADQQRRDIAMRQDQVIAGVARFDHTNLKRFQTVPYLALHMDAAGLEYLASRQDVVEIIEDSIEDIDLATSTVNVGATNAWADGYTGAGFAVATIDTGVAAAHAFFGGRVVAEACFSTTSGTSLSTCPNGANTQTGAGAATPPPSNVSGFDHGTHVAGITAGASQAFSGVAPGASVIAVNVFSRYNNQSDCGQNPAPCVRAFNSDVMAGLEYVYSLRNQYQIASANMSLGGGRFYAPCPGDSRELIAQNLKAVGIATVSSSGNAGYTDSEGAPSCAPSIISVGSTQNVPRGSTTESISTFSNSVGFMDFWAPGAAIRSSVPNGGFANLQGTSMSSPHLAGAYAVFRSAHPDMSVDQITGFMKAAGRMLTDTRNSVRLPRLQLEDAIYASRWVTADIYEGTVAAGAAGQVELTLDARALDPGSYTARLLISSNDAGQPLVTVGVTMVVLAPPTATLAVLSQFPDNDVPVIITPLDSEGLGSGRTPLTRAFYLETEVLLRAQAVWQGRPFVHWISGGQTYSNREVTFTISDDMTWTVVYESGVNTEGEGLPPATFALRGSSPNPFQSQTTVRFDLPETAEVSVSVYDLLGRVVLQVPASLLAAGSNHSVTVDGSSLPAGVYLYRVEAQGSKQTYVQSDRFVLVK
jgi:subtilisin family serine protease